MKKILITIVVSFITTQVYADLGDWFEKTANRFAGLDTSIVEVSELRYSYDEAMDYFRSTRHSTTFRDVTGKLTNNSDKDTIKTVVFEYEILECVTVNNCITIDEDEERWNTNIPPGQTRYFDHSIAYNKGDSAKSIYFIQNIKYVYPYEL